MATQQDAGGVPFAIAHDFQHFRLLELPPELVDLIDAPEPPALCIKSQPASSTSGTPSKPGYAVLCTPDKTYQLRQVQTSNSLFITQPALDAQDDAPPLSTTMAIASCTATLELQPSDLSPIAHLESVLPIYDLIDGEADVAGNGRSKPAIFADTPMSTAQCEHAWNQLMAFEFAGSSYRPSSNTIAQTWSAIHAAAAAEGIRLDRQFLTQDISTPVAEELIPATLTEAILRHLSPSDEKPDSPWSSLDRAKVVHLVGKVILDARTEKEPFSTAEFLDKWKDNLPEAWRPDAGLKAIEGIYDTPSSTTIVSKQRASAAAKAKGAEPTARKWHAKFGRARKT